MQISDELAKELADELEMGLACYYHIPSQTYECFPANTSVEDLADHAEEWAESYRKVEADEDNYVELIPMTSFEGFELRKTFAKDIEDKAAREALLAALDQPKPFRKFGDAAFELDYDDQWYAFQQQGYIDQVKKQIEEAIGE